jgi:hypothetical protein
MSMATPDSAEASASANDMKVVFTLELRDCDKKSRYRVNLANQVVEFMTREFSLYSWYTTNKEDAITLNVTIIACSEGSRWGRMCCGELGVGWVLLKLNWHLLSKDNKRLTNPTGERLRDSGALGFADLCEENFGEQRMLTYLASEAADTIAMKARSALSAEIAASGRQI